MGYIFTLQPSSQLRRQQDNAHLEKTIMKASNGCVALTKALALSFDRSNPQFNYSHYLSIKLLNRGDLTCIPELYKQTAQYKDTMICIKKN